MTAAYLILADQTDITGAIADLPLSLTVID